MVSGTLTPAESRVYDKRQSGKGYREIAEELGISVRTVELHAQRADRKLGIDRSRAAPRYVYLVRAGQYLKLGVAISYKGRIKTLQANTPHRITEIAVARTDNPLALEARLLDKYKSHKARGEWFHYSKELAKSLISDLSD